MDTAAEPRTLRPPAAVGRRHVALLYHPHVQASRDLAEQLAQRLRSDGDTARVLSAWDADAVLALLDDQLDFVVTLGGDGTILRAARLTAAHGIPLLGVNFGRLGYLTLLEPDEALEAVPRLLSGGAREERRLMLRCEAEVNGDRLDPIDAVNDVFLGRGRVARAVRLDLFVDGVHVSHFTADGVVVATPMGSTAYSLSAGGPIVVPRVEALVVTPVVPHPALLPPLVLPADATVEVVVKTDAEATLSVDGQIHQTLLSGDRITVRCAPHRACFLRFDTPASDYSSLLRRLGGT